jgi:hypothetical protein
MTHPPYNIAKDLGDSLIFSGLLLSQDQSEASAECMHPW